MSDDILSRSFKLSVTRSFPYDKLRGVADAICALGYKCEIADNGNWVFEIDIENPTSIGGSKPKAEATSPAQKFIGKFAEKIGPEKKGPPSDTPPKEKAAPEKPAGLATDRLFDLIKENPGFDYHELHAKFGSSTRVTLMHLTKKGRISRSEDGKYHVKDVERERLVRKVSLDAQVLRGETKKIFEFIKENPGKTSREIGSELGIVQPSQFINHLATKELITKSGKVGSYKHYARGYKKPAVKELKGKQKKFVLSVSDKFIIDCIKKHPGTTAAQIAGEVGIAQSTLMVRLREFQYHGLIKKRKSREDKRVLLYYLDNAADDKLEALMNFWKEPISTARRELDQEGEVVFAWGALREDWFPNKEELARFAKLFTENRIPPEKFKGMKYKAEFDGEVLRIKGTGELQEGSD